MGKNMSARSLRERYNRVFVTLERYPDWVAWSIVGFYILQIGVAFWIGTLLLSTGVGSWEAVAIIGLMLFIATRLRGLNNIVHECSHATFALHRPSNVAIGRLCSALTLSSFAAYRDEHLSHHKHVGDYERDLDLQGIEPLGLHDPLTTRVILRHAFTPLVLRHLPHYLKIDLSMRDGRFFQMLKLAFLGAIVLLIIQFPLPMALFAILPYVTMYTALNYWADCLDHAGLIETDDDLESSRNVLAPKVLSWLLFPRNDGYHLVHHLFPNVPARHLATAHSALLEDPTYGTMPNAVGGLRLRPDRVAPKAGFAESEV